MTKATNPKPTYNGEHEFELHITKGDINKGNNRDPARCAAAVAIMREDKAVKSVRVHLSRIFVEYDTHWERYLTPDSLRSEIVAFDRGGQILPGTHVVPPLSPAMVAQMERGKPKGPKKTSGEPRRSPKFLEDVRVRASLRRGERT